MAFGSSMISLGAGGAIDGSLNSFTYQGIKTGIWGQRDIWFSPDGTRYYATTYVNTKAYIIQYLLSTPWDIFTATVEYQRDLYAEFSLQSLVWGICLSYDGTRAWSQNQNTGSRAFIWSLSTPHDLSSATYLGTAGGGYNQDYLVAGWYENKNGGLAVSPDGSMLLHLNNNTRALACPSGNSYNVKLTAANMPTANDLFSSPLGQNKPRTCGFGATNTGGGCCYNGDGTKIYQAMGGTIYEFDTIAPYSTDSGVFVQSLAAVGGGANGIYITADNTKMFISQGSGVEVYTAG